MIGAVVLATNQGLGYLAKDFYDNGVIDKVFVYPHSSRKNHYDWYNNRVDKMEDLLDCDTILFFETPFDWTIILKARAKKVKTVLMPMYECTNYPLIYFPDVILTPSDLDQQYYPKGIRINVPIPKHIKWRERQKALVFVHNAGNGGLGGRNGTKELIEAFKWVKSPVKLIIRSQVPMNDVDDERIEVRVGQFDDIWSEGDVFIFPEAFNGLSLPIQEAYASGMVVMCGDRFPMNEWLPKEYLIPVKSYRKETLSTEFDYAEFSPEDIAEKIEEVYKSDIIITSRKGKKFGEDNSWKKLKAKYLKLL